VLKGISQFRYLVLVTLLPLILSSCSSAAQKSANSAASREVLSGLWDVDFDMGNNTFHSQMTLKQDGSQFFGEGVDANNTPFTIVNGQINGSQLDFFKKYNDSQLTTVIYHGTLSMVNQSDYQGPYVEGSYIVDRSHASGSWRAQMPSKLKAAAATVVPTPPVSTTTAPPATKAPAASHPNLSGNWNAAYEYDFGIVHSTMSLNQKGGAVTGHGVDSTTGEKFIIQKGWYKYPQLTLILSYKKKQGAKTDRNIIFKATVSVVNDSDYQGPYLSGKTEGGGSWEAQLASSTKPR
jgi:hypothetical protein